MLRLSCQESDHGLNTKVEEDFLRFPTVIYTPSNGRRFSHNDFQTVTKFAENCFSGQIAAAKEIKSAAVMVGLFP
jgi:hypothetical protein